MKICFLSLSSYPIITGKNFGYVGGAEVEQIHLAKKLVSNDYHISFITYKHGYDEVEYYDGIEIIKTYEREKVKVKNLLSKYMSIWSALKKANADIYFHEAGSHGILPIFCNLKKKKYVHRISSDSIVHGNTIFEFNSYIMNLIQKMDIFMADINVSQSEYQKKTLKKRFNINSIVIKNPLPIINVNNKKPDIPIVLWVGSIRSVKNPHLYLELAKNIPNAQFEMVGGITNEAQLYNYVKKEAKKIPNLFFRDFTPPNEMNQIYNNASILVNTSSYEGFPQTFLEAWMHYMPVITINIDPDGIIKKENLGFCSENYVKLVDNVNILLNDKALRNKMGLNGRKYIERENNIDIIVNKYISLFNYMFR